MTRTLPWLKSSTATTASTARSKQAKPNNPSKRQRLLDPSSDSDTHNAPRTSPSKRRAQLAARSPSTSPPPAPPTEEPMRPGLHADDIYIMVEDEFLSVARTFTAHLHHAEYVRLKNEAKNRNASTISSISRPVDSITTMRAETKKKKEAEAQEARTKRGVESVIPKRRKELDESEESEFDANEGQEAPWQGTHLHQFMTTSPRRALTGLTGLQGVTANTRAAAGYSKPEKKEQRSKRPRSPTPTPGKAKGRRIPAAMEVDDSTSESSDDDDLDAPSRAPSRAPLPPVKAPAVSEVGGAKTVGRPVKKAKPPSPPRPPPKRAFLDMAPIPKSSPSNNTVTVPKNTVQIEAEPPTKQEIADNIQPASSREEVLARRRRLKARKEAEKGTVGVGMKVDEIPIFLV